MQQRNLLQYIIICLKGIAMGAADVVPGVSGGTIAFISGIYEELIETINLVSFKTLKTFRKDGLNAGWKAINGSFLVSLLLGIGISVVSLAKGLSYLLENKPVLVWSFFFGLVFASILFVGKQIKNWSVVTVLMLLSGALIAFYITTLQPMVTENSSPIYLFLAGSLAICAMILPGISGAFILVLLGAYKPILDAVHTRNLQLIAITGAGAIVGILTFSRILKWLFKYYKNLTLAILTGFIIGSLNKIWPWKNVLETKMFGDKEIVLNEQSVWPTAFEGNAQWGLACGLALLGFMLIVALDKIANSKI